MSEMYYEIGVGWIPLVETFLKLAEWDAQYNKTPPVQILQVKEKFGELRIYYSGGDKRTDAYVTFAMAMSKQMCEECGAPAVTSNKKGWIKTVCDEHI